MKSLRDETVQRALIAAGSLNAVVGRASWLELRAAIERFRKAHRFDNGSRPLTEKELVKLEGIYEQFSKATGLKQRSCEDPVSKTKVIFYLPERLVGTDALDGAAGNCGGESSVYVEKNWKLVIGPAIYPLNIETPISLFRSNIMKYSVVYNNLHLTSDEFTTLGEVSNDIGGYVSYNLAFSAGDQLKALFMRYAKHPPDGFEVPDFLLPMLDAEAKSSEAEAKPPDEARLDAKTRGWQLLMQGVTNLIASDFPFDNGWKKATSKACPVNQETTGGQRKKIRILFGTDRQMKPTAPPRGKTAHLVSPDSLFGNSPGHRLRMGCAYVVEGGDANQPIVEYHLFHDGDEGDLGERTYLTDEIGPRRDRGGNWIGADALVFIHGYRVAFKDALYTVAKIVAETGYQGRVYLYSWPSRETTFGYFQDLDNAEQAEPYFQSFMRMVMRDAHVYEIDLMAHSMGSQSMLRAVSALRPLFDTERGEGALRRGKVSRSIRIGQMIFAAPDVSRAVFSQKIDRIAPYADRVTVYVSSTDLALSASKTIRSGSPRMGDIDKGEPALIGNSKVHIIDATQKQTWFQGLLGGGYGHDYLSQSPGVRDDIKDILTGRGSADEQPPDERRKKRFEKRPYTSAQGKFYWKLIEGK